MTGLLKPLRGWAVAVSLSALAPGILAAVKCTVTTTPVVFSAYNVWDQFPNNSGIGSVSIDCKGGGGSSVTLSTGQSNSYAQRTMKSGANTLDYNLYTTAARDLVWGDGNGGSSFLTTDKNATVTLNVFGQIPAGQDVAVGTYTDSVTVFVEF